MLAQMQRPTPKPAMKPAPKRAASPSRRVSIPTKGAAHAGPLRSALGASFQAAGGESAPALVRAPAGLQRKAACGCDARTPAITRPGGACAACDPKHVALERPSHTAQTARAVREESDPAERQASALGARIGADLGAAGSVGSGPLPPTAQRAAEKHLGVSLAGTELRGGADGHDKAMLHRALAVTEGSTVSFREGHLSTATPDGRELLGHELTHVAQQRASDVETPQGFTVGIPLPDLQILPRLAGSIALQNWGIFFIFPILGAAPHLKGFSTVAALQYAKGSLHAGLSGILGPVWLRDIEVHAGLGSAGLTAGASARVEMSFGLSIEGSILAALTTETMFERTVPPKLKVVMAGENGLTGTIIGSALSHAEATVALDVDVLTGQIVRFHEHEEIDVGLMEELAASFVHSTYLEYGKTKKMACRSKGLYGPKVFDSAAYRVILDLGYSAAGPSYHFGIGAAPLPIADLIKEVGYVTTPPPCPQVEPILPLLVGPPPTSPIAPKPPSPWPGKHPGPGHGPGPLAAKSNRVRFQLQHKGDDVVKSEAIERDSSVTVSEGKQAVDNLLDKAAGSVQDACEGAGKKMKSTLEGYPPNGVDSKGNVARKKCDQHPDYKRGIRMDLENLAGRNFTS